MEEMSDFSVVVHLIFLFGESMIFAGVHQKDEGFFHPPHRGVHFNPLMPVHRAILIAKRHEQGRSDVLCLEQGRVGDVLVHHFPVGFAQATLAGFKNLLVGRTGIPVDRIVHTDHIGEGGARYCSREKLCLGHEKSRSGKPPIWSWR